MKPPSRSRARPWRAGGHHGDVPRGRPTGGPHLLLLLNKKTPAVATDRLVCAPPCVCTALCVHRLVCAPPCVCTDLYVDYASRECQHPPPPRDCIIARPVCPSNENKRVYSFILFILPFWLRLGCFSMFFLCFFVFFGCFPEVYTFSICCCPSLHPFFSPKVYVLHCLEHILSRRVSMRCKHHGIEIRNNGIGVHI